MLSSMNRRWVLRLRSGQAALLPFVLLLAACTPDVPELPSEEVLRRATLQAQTTTAAAFSADGTMSYTGGAFGNGNGTLHADGLLTNSGDTVATTFDVALHFQDPSGTQSDATTLLDTILVQGERLYLKIHRLESPSMGGLFDPMLVTALQNTWWIFDAPEEDSSPSVTPSVQLLQAQASVVTVTRDLGVTKLEGVPVYHYAVAIDPERFLEYARELHRESEVPLDEEGLRVELGGLQATGELWIRASDFGVAQMAWEIPALPLPDHSLLALSFTMRWTDAAGAPPIVIPSDAKPFSAEALLPEETTPPATELPEGLQEEDIRSALEDYSDTAIFPPLE